MDSNGEHDHEIINGGQNNLENPQWSSDSLYISYVLGNISESPIFYGVYIYNLSIKEPKKISGDLVRLNNYRYYAWIPNSKDIIFNEGPGTSGFKLVHTDSAEPPSVFFDTTGEDIQPRINILGSGYLLTYTIVNLNNSHDIYAVIDSNSQIPFDGTPVRLTRTNGGTDHPILAPDSKTIYYVREGKIFKVDFNIEGNKIILIPGANTDDSEYYGDFVLNTGTVTDNPSFDIAHMDTFFPLQ